MKLLKAISRWIYGSSIGFKLGFSVGLVLLLTLLLGAFSIFNLAQVNQFSSDLAVKWMPSIGHSTGMRTAMLDVRLRFCSIDWPKMIGGDYSLG